MTDILPTPAEYRLAAEDIDPARCLARHLGDYLTRDMRWKPAVSYEIQCARHRVTNGDLCSPCKKRQDTNHRLWLGRVTEDPPAHCHMLGTEWAKKCKWIGDADVVLPPQPIPYVEESVEVHSPNESTLPTPEIQTVVTPPPEPTFYIADFPTEPPKMLSREESLFFPRKVILGIGLGVLSAYFLYKIFCHPTIPFPDVDPNPPSTPLQKFLFVEGLLKKWSS